MSSPLSDLCFVNRAVFAKFCLKVWLNCFEKFATVASRSMNSKQKSERAEENLKLVTDVALNAVYSFTLPPKSDLKTAMGEFWEATVKIKPIEWNGCVQVQTESGSNNNYCIQRPCRERLQKIRLCKWTVQNCQLPSKRRTSTFEVVLWKKVVE